jgi:hypothetical protein
LPPAALPLTVTFHPAPDPVASRTEKFVIVVFVVCAWPFKVIAVNVGSAGAVENDSDPPVTVNVVWSFEVAASALAGARTAVSATLAAATTTRFEIEIPMTFTSVLLDRCEAAIRAAIFGQVIGRGVSPLMVTRKVVRSPPCGG